MGSSESARSTRSIVAVCGLRREAGLVARYDTRCIIGGGVRALLEQRLDRALNTQTLGIVSIGICGALQPDLKVGECVIASEVIAETSRYPVDAMWAQRLSEAFPHAIVGKIAGTDMMLVEPAQKQAVYHATGAIAADMESHVAAQFAATRRIPLVALRVVSDDAWHTLPPAAFGAMKDDGSVNVPAVIGSLLRNPFQLPALLRAARDSEIAFVALLRCLDRLGPRLMGPDLA